jgi:hypothetical protein
LSIEGGVEIDGHRIALATLLEAIAQGRRYVVVGAQMFIGLAADLRERLEAAAELLHAGRGGLEAGLSAAPVLADLEDEERATDAAWRSLRERTAAARALDPELPPDCTPTSAPTSSKASAGSRGCRRGAPAPASPTTWGSARPCKPWPCSCTAPRLGRRW